MDQKKRILFIINPISGTRRKQRLPHLIETYLDQSVFDYSISYTQYAGHAIELAREAVENGYHIIVAVGGDGSINDIGNALMGTEVALGIIPIGSGNGLARHLKISRNIKKAIRTINKCHIKKIDTASFAAGKFFFSNIGIGFPADVALKFEGHPVRGFLSYVIAVIRELFNYNFVNIEVEIDNQKMQRKVVLFNIYNSNQHGYEVGLAPHASLDDGMLDIVILARPSRLRLALYAIFILSRQLQWVKHLETFRAADCKVINKHQDPWLLQVDGECRFFNEDWNVKIHPLSLKVIAP